MNTYEEKQLLNNYNRSAYKCTFEEFKAFQCSNCKKEGCPHREAFRRVPTIDGGLGLCPNLKK